MRSRALLFALCSSICISACDDGPTPTTGLAPEKVPVVAEEPKADPTRDPEAGEDPDGTTLRARNMAKLEAAGFRPAKSLPTRAQRANVPGKLRPLREIAGRALALKVVYVWCSAPEAAMPTASLREYIANNELEKFMTADEREIVGMDREQAKKTHAPTVGWRLENLWALAWVLGYAKEPPAHGAMIPVEVTQEVVLEFLPSTKTSLDEFVRGAQLRPEQTVAATEDLFYCAHNAGRSAQNGSADAVPKGFDSTAGTGVVHERRHALTWVLSPGTTWDETDLST